MVAACRNRRRTGILLFERKRASLPIQHEKVSSAPTVMSGSKGFAGCGVVVFVNGG